MTHRALIALALMVSACGGASRIPTNPTTNPTTPQPVPQPVPPPSPAITGTVIDENGAPLGGATVSLSRLSIGSTPTTAVTHADGRYEITLPGGSDYGGRADKPGYETTWRDSYFAEGPNVLNFRLFQTLRIGDADSAHVTITKDGSVCGINDEWLCRTVRVTASRAGTLTVQGVSDNPSIPAVVAIDTIGYQCCPAPTSVAVAAGDEVSVYVQLVWNGPVTGVTVRTSLR